MPPRYLGPPIVVPPPREREGTFGNGGYWGTSDNIPTTMTLAQMYEASQRHPRYLGPPVQDPGGGTSIPNPNVNVHPVLPPGMGVQVQGPDNPNLPPGLNLRTGKWDSPTGDPPPDPSLGAMNQGLRTGGPNSPRYLGPPVPSGVEAQVQGPGNGPPGLDLRTGKWDLQGAPQTSYSSQGWTGARPRRSPMLRTF